MSEVRVKRWPKFDALCGICEEYSRSMELHVGGIVKDENNNEHRNLTMIVISSGEKKLLSQRIVKGDLDKAAEDIQSQLSA